MLFQILTLLNLDLDWLEPSKSDLMVFNRSPSLTSRYISINMRKYWLHQNLVHLWH